MRVSSRTSTARRTSFSRARRGRWSRTRDVRRNRRRALGRCLAGERTDSGRAARAGRVLDLPALWEVTGRFARARVEREDPARRRRPPRCGCAQPLARRERRGACRTAVLEGGRANWPMAVGEELVAWDGTIRTQWCHGAAGVVEAASGYLDLDLLQSGAELVWHAGPPSMDKGPGLCHGTGGSGFALLKVFARTQDELWLDRARRFAMHAAGQVERWRAVAVTAARPCGQETSVPRCFSPPVSTSIRRSRSSTSSSPRRPIRAARRGARLRRGARARA